MSEFNIEDLEAVIAVADSSLVQMMALQLRRELEDSAKLREQLEESQREFRSADITMQNLEAQLKQSKIDADCYKKGMEASNARLVQIAAELSAIDAIHNDAVFITDAHYEQCPPGVQKIVGALAVLQIPAYQSFLAEVRAQARTDFIGRIEWIIRNECNPEKTETILNELQSFSETVSQESTQ
ncbi:hypothetical protein ACO1Y9_09085 [Klebsiella quasipneumoniae]|uniref:hypothetical protein n=1 Tax=Klebsiella quasipneumoniae TaxID=1463165 RepID=UPI003BF7233A